MIFNSIEFAVFLPIVFGIYWMLQGNIKRQNLFLLLASYFFYGWWDWRFLFLIALSSGVDFIVGQRIHHADSRQHQKYWLWLSLAVNLGLLGFFKYYNFFLDNFVQGFTLLGSPFEAERLSIVLPVGISFYTFQTLSYTIDIYKGRMKPTSDVIAFFGYVSFFPQLVAGPIERATDLVPQFLNKRHFSYSKSVDGMRQILIGLFKKVVIADNCAPYVQDIFSSADQLHSPILFLGMFFFLAQLYTDFAGYSDIAIGTARLFGFNLSKNFNAPAFSKSIPEFWSKWHITMTTWFRDYVYMTLVRWKRKGFFKFFNIVVLFTLIGFWHGAKWTFIFYGLSNAILYIIQNAWSRRKFLKIKFKQPLLNAFHLQSRIWSNYFLLMVTSVFFRAQTIDNAFNYILRSFNPGNFYIWDVLPERLLSVKFIFFLIVLYLFVEWFQKEKEHLLDLSGRQLQSWMRWSIYFVLLWGIFQYRGVELDFIYFQF